MDQTNVMYMHLSAKVNFRPVIRLYNQDRKHPQIEGGFLYGSGPFKRVDVVVSLLADVF